MAGRGRFWCGAVAKNSPSTPTISVTLPPGKIRWRRLSEWPHNAGKSSNALRLPRANAGWITTRFATGKVGTGTSRWPCWPMLCCRCCAHAEKKTPNAQVRLSVPELRHLLTALLCSVTNPGTPPPPTTTAPPSTCPINPPPPAAKPTFAPPGGPFSTPQPVTITSTTPGAKIYYTTDGSTPTTGSNAYTTAVAVSSTETIQAIATAPGYTTSALATAAYTITQIPATAPAFSPVAGTYSAPPPLSVTIFSTTPGSTIYYTTDGSTPTTTTSNT